MKLYGNEFIRINSEWDHQIVPIKAIRKMYHLPICGIRLWLRSFNYII
jgi:hypothetical protein